MNEVEAVTAVDIVSLRAEHVAGYYPEFCPWQENSLMSAEEFMKEYLKQVEGASYMLAEASRGLCAVCERTWNECTGHPHFIRFFRLMPMIDKIPHMYRLMRDRVFFIAGHVYPRSCTAADVGKKYAGKESRPTLELKEGRIQLKIAQRRSEEGVQATLYDYAFNMYMYYKQTGDDTYLHYFTHIGVVLPGMIGHASERNANLLKTYYYAWYKLRTHVVQTTYADIMEQTSGEDEMLTMQHAVRLLQDMAVDKASQDRLAIFLLQSENSTANILLAMMEHTSPNCIAFGHAHDDDLITKCRNYLYFKVEKESDQKYPRQGLMQSLGSKNGLIRQAIMGKRLARFVRTPISPAANVRADFVTCPRLGMETLTKEYVASSSDPLSIEYARRLLDQQLLRHIQTAECMRDIDYERRCYASCKVCRDCIQNRLNMLQEIDGVIVFRRQIQECDVGIMNRQPTLSKRSVHGVRVLRGCEQTLGLPVGTATSFNADFDGDEMHFWYPEGHIAESEIRLCMSVRNNIDAFCELGQDSMHGLYLLTRPSTRLTTRMFFNGVTTVAALIDLELDVAPHHEYSGADLFNVLASVEWMRPVFVQVFGRSSLPSRTYIGEEHTFVIRDSSGLLGMTVDGYWAFDQTGMEFNAQFVDGSRTCFQLFSPQLGYAVDYHGQQTTATWHWDTVPVVGDAVRMYFDGNWLDVRLEVVDSVVNKAVLRKFQHAVVAMVTSDANAIAAFDALTALGIFAIDTLGSTLCYKDFRVQTPPEREHTHELIQVCKHHVLGLRNVSYTDFTDRVFAFTQSRISNMNKHSSWSGIKQFTHGSCSKGDPQKLREMTALVGVRDLARTFVYGDLARTTHYWPHRSEQEWNITERGLVTSTYIEGLSPENMCIEYMTSRLNLAKSKLDVPITGYMNRKLHATCIDIVKSHDGTVRDNNRILVFSPQLYVPEYEKAWRELIKQYGADFEDRAAAFLHGGDLSMDVHTRTQIVRCAMQPGCPIGIIAASDITQAFTQSALNSFHSTMSSTDGAGEISFILEQAKDSVAIDGNALCFFGLRDNATAAQVLYHCAPLTLSSVIRSMEVVYKPSRFAYCISIEELLENGPPPLWDTVLRCNVDCRPHDMDAVVQAIASYTHSYVVADCSERQTIWIALVRPTQKRGRMQAAHEYNVIARTEMAAMTALRNLVLSGSFTRDLESKISRRRSKRGVKAQNSSTSTHRFLQVQWKGLRVKGKRKGQSMEVERIGVHWRNERVEINACHIMNVLRDEALIDLVDLTTIHSNWHASNQACLGIEAATAFMRKNLRTIAPKVHPFLIEVLSQHLAWTGRIQSTNHYGNIQAKSPLDSISFERVMKFVRRMDSKPRPDALLTHSARTMFSLEVAVGSGMSEIKL